MSVQDYKDRIDKAQAARARAQVEYDNASARLVQARQTLKEDFGVETTDDARALLTDLTRKRDEAVAAVEAALEEAGA